MSDDPDFERLKLVGNERTKLSATFLNGTAIAIFAVGGLTVPLNGVVQGHATISASAAGLICTLASVALHFMARFLLRGLQ